MIRYLLFTFLGFLGSALFLLIVRVMLYRFKTQILQCKKNRDIIDITPVEHPNAQRIYLVVWVILGLSVSAYIMTHLNTTSPSPTTYIPAHIDAQGNFVPSQTQPLQDLPDSP